MQKRSASLANSFLVIGGYFPDMEVLFRKIGSKMKENLSLEKKGGEEEEKEERK